MEKNKKTYPGGIPLAVSITGAYILVGLGWILLSDAILEFLVKDKIQLTAMQTVKGWFFILATGTILYFLLRRYTSRIHFGEENFRKTVEEVKDYAVIVLDKNGNVITWNKGAERMFGYKEEEITGENYSVFFPEEDRKNNVPEKNLELASSGRYFTEGKRVRKDGTAFYAHATMTSFRIDKRGVTGFLKIIHDITEMKRTEETLLQNHTQIRGLIEHLELVREEERLNIAREIHDELGQMLTSLKIDLSFLGKEAEAVNPSVPERIYQMKDKIDSLIQSVRRIASDLRPHDIDVLGLEATIESEAASLRQRLGMEITFSSDLKGLSLDQKTSIGAYRIFQEAFTNILRHSQASKVSVRLKYLNGNFILKIEDNGQGFDTSKAIKSSYGIIGMKERASIMGGELKITSSPSEGTSVELIIPAGKLV